MSSAFDVTAAVSTPAGLLPRGVRTGRISRPSQLGARLAPDPREGNVLVFSGPGAYAPIGAPQGAAIAVPGATIEWWMRSGQKSKQTIVVAGPVNSTSPFVPTGTVTISVQGDQVLVSVAGKGRTASTITSPDTRPITDGAWHHVAVVFNANFSVSVYKDGVAVGTVKPPFYGILDIAAAIWVGNSAALDQPGFVGQIFDVRVWSTVRTATQIQSARFHPPAADETNLVTLLGLNRTTGQALDLISGTSAALHSATIGWQSLPVQPTTALSLQGGNDWVDIDAVAAVTSDAATFECWLQLTPAAAATAQTIMLCQQDGADPGPRFSYDGGDRLGFFWTAGSGRPWSSWTSGDTTVISDGQWHHVAVVFDLGTVTFYKDGLPLPGSYQIAAPLSSNSDVQVGPGVGSTSSLNGLITDVRMWKVARSAAEISSFRFAALTGQESGLLALCTLAGADPANPATMVPVDLVTGNVGQLNGNAAVVVAALPVEPAPAEVWQFALAGSAPIGPLLTSDGVVCVDNQSPSSHLRSVDLQTSQVRWSYDPNVYSSGSGSFVLPVLAVDDTTAYAGVHVPDTIYGNIALHAIDIGNGSAVWSRPAEILASSFLTQPVVTGNRIVVGVNATPQPTVTAAALAVIDTVSGAVHIGQVLQPNPATFMSDPLVADTVVYIAAAFASGSVVASIDVSTSPPTTLWSFTAPAEVTGSLAPGASTLFAPVGGTLLCLDVATGHQLWSHQLSNSPVTNKPIQLGGTVYVGSSDGILYALDAATGTEQWRVDTQSAIVTDLVNEDGVLYFANQGDGQDTPPAFVAVDTNSRGVDVLTYSVPQADTISFAQSAANGVVYFYGAQTVYAVNMTNVVREFDITTKLIVENYDTTTAGGPTGNDTSYRVSITIRDEYGSPRPNQAVKIWAAEPVYVINQGSPLTLGPTQPVWMQTDQTANLTLAISAFDNGTPQGNPNITCPAVCLWATFMPTEAAVTIYPDGEQLTTLAGVQGAAPSTASRRSLAAGGPSMYLGQATGYDGQPMILSQYSDTASLTNIASCIRNTVGSPEASPVSATRKTPHRRFVTPSTVAHTRYLAQASAPTTRPYAAGAVPTFTVAIGTTLTFAANSYDPSAPTGLAVGHRVRGVFSDIDHFTNNVVKGAEQVAKMAWQAVDNVVTTVIHTAENTYNLVIRTVEDAVTAVVGFLKTVVADIRKVLQWLSTLFQWKNFVLNHTYLRQQISNPSDPANPGMFDRMQTWLATTAAADAVTVAGALTGHGGTPAGLNGQTVQATQSSSPSTTSDYNYGNQNNASQCTWMQQKLNENSGGASLTKRAGKSPTVASPDPTVISHALTVFLGQVESQLQTTGSQLPGQIGAALASLRSNFSSPKAIVSTALTDVVAVLEVLADDIIAFGKALAADFIALLNVLLGQMVLMINDPIDIPFLGPLYQALTGNPLTSLDLICLMMAIPATILVDIITGSPLVNPTTTTGAAASNEAGRIVMGTGGLIVNDLTVLLDTLSLGAGLKVKTPAHADLFSRIDVAFEIINLGLGMGLAYLATPFEDHDWVWWAAQSVPVTINFGYLFASSTGADQAVRDSRLAAAQLALAAVYAQVYPGSYRDAPKAPGLVVSANIFGAMTGLVEFMISELDPESTADGLTAKLVLVTVSSDLNFVVNVVGAIS